MRFHPPGDDAVDSAQLQRMVGTGRLRGAREGRPSYQLTVPMDADSEKAAGRCEKGRTRPVHGMARNLEVAAGARPRLLRLFSGGA